MNREVVILTTAVPAEVRSALAMMAHRRSIQAGKTVSMNNLIREALREHLGLPVPDSEPVGRPKRGRIRHRDRTRNGATGCNVLDPNQHHPTTPGEGS